MAALIEFVCIWKHADRGDSSVTVEQGVWAYCAAGALDGHHWTRIDPTTVETVRSRPGYGRAYFVRDETDELSLASDPAR
jgi:hypothetical protein